MLDRVQDYPNNSSSKFLIDLLQSGIGACIIQRLRALIGDQSRADTHLMHLKPGLDALRDLNIK